MNGMVVAAGLALLASASAPQHPAVAQENERSYLAAARLRAQTAAPAGGEGPPTAPAH